MKKAVIVLPTYNEGGNIESLINAIFDEAKTIPNWIIEILVVDSNSQDKTAVITKSLIKKYPTKLHLLETKKEGLGKAYVDGFSYSIKHLNPYVMFEMDADWSHNPKEIAKFLKKIETGADIVYGSRYIKGGSIPGNWGLHRKIFSVFGNMIIRLGFMKLKITDWTNGFRAIKTWVLKDLLKELETYSGYIFQIALIDKALKKRAYISEVPINFRDREKGISKIIFSQYVLQILIYIFLNSSFIKFVIVGALGFIIDFGISFLIIEKIGIRKNLYWLATIISAETAITFNFFLNNFWSFAHKKIEHKMQSYVLQFIKFNFISSGSILIQAVGIQLLTHLLTPDYWYIYKIFIIIFLIIPYSYFFYNRFVWKKR